MVQNEFFFRVSVCACSVTDVTKHHTKENEIKKKNYMNL